MREVEFKRWRWHEKHSHQAANYLSTHRFPVVLGPDARHYLIDRHHLTLALNDEGMIWELPVSIVANMSGLGFDRFWATLESRNWTHPFDDEGRRCPYDDMPASVDDLTTIPIARWQERSKGLVDTPRTKRPSVNSGGRISCAAASRANWSSAISAAGWRWR